MDKANLISCPVCGNNVSKNAFACPQCGEPFNHEVFRKSAHTEKFKLKAGFFGTATVLHIRIDGAEAFDMKSGNERHLTLFEGQHTISVDSWAYSGDTNFVIEKGIYKCLEMKSKGFSGISFIENSYNAHEGYSSAPQYNSNLLSQPTGESKKTGSCLIGAILIIIGLMVLGVNITGTTTISNSSSNNKFDKSEESFKFTEEGLKIKLPIEFKLEFKE